MKTEISEKNLTLASTKKIEINAQLQLGETADCLQGNVSKYFPPSSQSPESKTERFLEFRDDPWWERGSPPVYTPPSPQSSESTTERLWEFRDDPWWERGHSPAYCSPSPSKPEEKKERSPELGVAFMATLLKEFERLVVELGGKFVAAGVAESKSQLPNEIHHGVSERAPGGRTLGR